MKRENIIQRITNFFDDFEEPLRTQYIEQAIKNFDILRTRYPKCISDTRTITYAIDITLHDIMYNEYF